MKMYDFETLSLKCQYWNCISQNVTEPEMFSTEHLQTVDLCNRLQVFFSYDIHRLDKNISDFMVWRKCRLTLTFFRLTPKNI